MHFKLLLFEHHVLKYFVTNIFIPILKLIDLNYTGKCNLMLLLVVLFLLSLQHFINIFCHL